MGFMNRLFFTIGKGVADRPILTIITSVVFIMVGALGFINLTLQSDAQALWVPKDSRPNLEQEYFQKKFGSFFRTNQLIIHPRDSEDGDLFQPQYLAMVSLLQTAIQQANYVYSNESSGLSEFCYRPISGKGCLVTSPLEYFHNDIDVLKVADVKEVAKCITPYFNNSRTCFDSIGVPVIPDVVFGKKICVEEPDSTTCSPCNINATALFVTFLLNNNDYTNPAAAAWEKDVYENFTQIFNGYFDGNVNMDYELHRLINKTMVQDFPGKEVVPLHVDYLAQRSISDQLDEQNTQNAFVVIVSYCLMFVYISIALGFFPSFIHTRFLLGLSGILIVVSSLLVAIGIVLYAGMSLSLISTEVVPFLILAIGVDNMFIIARAEREAPSQIVSIENRVAYGMGRIGPSIFTAAFCEFLAFIIGMLTDVPALSQFCLVAALAVVADFILQITTFTAVLTLDSKRIQQNRFDICPCFKRDRKVGHRKEIVKRVFKKCYIPCISHWASKVAVGVFTVFFFVFGILGCINIGLGMNQLVSLIDGSDTFQYFENLDTYGDAGPPGYLVFKNVNYTDNDNLAKLDEINDGLSLLKDTVVPPVFSWVQPFKQFKDSSGQWAKDCNSSDVQGLGFDEQMKKFVLIPVTSECCQNYGVCGEQYVGDIVFDDKGRVATTRFRFQHTALKTQTDYIKGLTQTQAVADQYKHTLLKRTDIADPDDWDPDSTVFTYSLFYVYFAQYTYIRGVMFQNMLISMAAIILAIEIITNWKIALFVTITVFLTSFDLIGFMYLINLMVGGFVAQFNAVFVVNIVMSMGLAVEFCAHIAIAFLKVEGTRQDRARLALENMGSAVLVGIASTKLIGVIVLAFAPSNIFKLYYFRMYLLIILLGVFNGLMLMPTLLSLIGPEPDLSLDVEKPRGGKLLSEGMSSSDDNGAGSILNVRN